MIKDINYICRDTYMNNGIYIAFVLTDVNLKWWWYIYMSLVNVTIINNFSFPANNITKEDCIFWHCDIFWFERPTCQSSFTFHVILSKTVRFLYQILLKVGNLMAIPNRRNTDRNVKVLNHPADKHFSLHVKSSVTFNGFDYELSKF